VKTAFLELYNEEFHDLLDPKSFQGGKSKEISIREEKMVQFLSKVSKRNVLTLLRSASTF